jgi:hypothetical protein
LIFVLLGQGLVVEGHSPSVINETSNKEEGKGNHNEIETQNFNMKNPSNTEGKKPRSPANKITLYRGVFTNIMVIL